MFIYFFYYVNYLIYIIFLSISKDVKKGNFLVINSNLNNKKGTFSLICFKWEPPLKMLKASLEKKPPTALTN